MNLDNYVNEQKFLEENIFLLDILLIDRTTKKNIIWATNNYSRKGYFEKYNIYSINVIGRYNPIKPRVEKSKLEQTKRSKDMAEVFTASWICNNQNNVIDDQWFGYIGAFNIVDGQNWAPTERVKFINGKSWKDYVRDIRLEITCGEAPYLVSRYDTVTGNKIEIKSRIGLFDRKMRVINENAETDDEWIKESLVALKSVYGYEYQGDNLLIARENMLFSYIDYYYDRFNSIPNTEILKEVAEIISWNLWQMDGLKLVVPLSCHEEEDIQLSLFTFEDEEPKKAEFCRGCKEDNVLYHNGKRCVIMDWEKNKPVKFITLFHSTRSS